MGSSDDMPGPDGVPAADWATAVESLRRTRHGGAYCHLELLASLFDLTAAVGEAFLRDFPAVPGDRGIVPQSRYDVETFERIARHMAEIVRSVGIVDVPLTGDTFGADLRFLAALSDSLDAGDEPAADAPTAVVEGRSHA